METEIEVKTAGRDQVTPRVKMLAVSEKGSGATGFALTAPDPIFAACNANYTDLADAQARYVDITGEADLFKLKLALEMGKIEAGTLVVDRVDELQRVLVQQKLRAERRDFMKADDWNWIASKMNGIFEAFDSLDMHIIYLAAAKDFGGFDGTDLVTKSALQGSPAYSIYDYVDYAFFLDRKVYNLQNDEEMEDETCLITVPTVKYPWCFDLTSLCDPIIDLTFDNDFGRIHDLRKTMDFKPSHSVIVDVSQLEAVDETGKDLSVPGLSKQDKIAKMLSGNKKS